MKRPTHSARLILLALLGLALIVLLGLLLMAADTALSVWERVQHAPWPFAVALGVVLLVCLGVGARIAWWLLRPPRKRRAQPPAPPTRGAIEARVAKLQEEGASTADARSELADLDRRASSGRIHVALFGEINAGKSSILKALVPDADVRVDVIGGSTAAVALYETRLPGGAELVVADLPGINQARQDEAARQARAEALRSHVVVYVCDGDLGRSEREALDDLAALDKPLVVALNKSDRYRDDELDSLGAALARLPGVDRVVAVSAGGKDTRVRRRADGSEASEEVDRPANTHALERAILDLASRGFESLEPGREAAVLGALDRDLAHREEAVRGERAAELVRGYTRRAVVGALAAVAPGTDLVIQGALATALLRSLGRVYEVPVRDMDADAFLARVGGTVRTTTSITLAIAGNALKAFPGIGTLAGGLVHALAYGLIFDALGRAVAETLAQQRRFDAEHAASAFERRLRDPSEGRLQTLTTLAIEELRSRGRRDEDEDAR